MVLNMGEFQNRIGSTRIDVQQEVRRALDWMVRDMRQTSRGKMNVVDTTDGLPKNFVDIVAPASNVIFETPVVLYLCQGYTPGVGPDWSDGDPSGTDDQEYTISYDFDPANEIVTRTFTDPDPVTGSISAVRFNYITNLVFTTIDANSFRVDITGQKIAKRGPTGDIVQAFSLNETIRMRNE
jgi:hypothetical protein